MSELFGKEFRASSHRQNVGLDADTRAEGVVVAHRTNLEICNNPKAPAQARVAAARALAEMGGALRRVDRQAEAEAGGKELHEMNATELAAYRYQLERQRVDLSALEETNNQRAPDNAFD